MIDHKTRAQHRRHVINSYRMKADAKRKITERFADFMTSIFGSISFLFLNILFFGAWIIVNLGLVPSIAAFDPYPFGLLTMVMSIEAIILAIIVLVAQNRAAKIAEVREEVDLQINSIAEGEITKTIKMLALLLEKNDIDIKHDPELHEMVRPIKNEEIEEAIETQLSKSLKSS